MGKALKVDYVISGNVAELGDSYVLNVKAVTSSGEELRRIVSDPLRGNQDELIEAIRVAAYRLLSPEELVGEISILADRTGATVELDGQVVGKTPLPAPIQNVSLGKHQLRVSAGEFGEFESEIDVRFQKSTRVIVQLVDLRIKEKPKVAANLVETRPKKAPPRWYQSKWVLVGAGIGTAIIGGYIGYRLFDQNVVSCNEEPSQCMQ